MSTTLDLRGLTDSARDMKVSACIGAHIAKLPNMHFVDHVHVYGGEYPDVSSVPDYATSADAVLPLLEKFPKWLCEDYAKSATLRYSVQIWAPNRSVSHPPQFHHNAPTFALAACLALLRANGYEVLT